MVFFGAKKKDVLDLSEYYRKQQERIKNMKEDSQDAMEKIPVSIPKSSESSSSGGMFSIFGGSAPSPMSAESYSTDSYSVSEEKRKKLTKRIMDMTDKLEELSNQIYHLQQRIEVVERKLDVNRF